MAVQVNRLCRRRRHNIIKFVISSISSSNLRVTKENTLYAPVCWVYRTLWRDTGLQSNVLNLTFNSSNPAFVELPYTPVSLTTMEDGWMSPDWDESSNSPSLTRMVFSQQGIKPFVFGYLAQVNVLQYTVIIICITYNGDIFGPCNGTNCLCLCISFTGKTAVQILLKWSLCLVRNFPTILTLTQTDCVRPQNGIIVVAFLYSSQIHKL